MKKVITVGLIYGTLALSWVVLFTSGQQVPDTEVASEAQVGVDSVQKSDCFTYVDGVRYCKTVTVTWEVK